MCTKRNATCTDQLALRTVRNFLSLWSILLVSATLMTSLEKSANASSYILYGGTYTVRGSEGIYAFRFDSDSGHLTPLGLQAKTDNPSFLTIDSKRSLLFAVNEVNEYRGKHTGSVSAYKIEGKTGRLHLLNTVASLGAGPCYLSLDKTGKYVFVANFHGGSIAGFPILRNGQLGNASFFVQNHGSGADSIRQRSPHPHSVETSPDNRFVLAADLGLDSLFVFPFDPSTGRISESQVRILRTKAGAGPRHIRFGSDGRHLYVVNEINSTVGVFAFEQTTGSVEEVDSISTLPNGATGPNDAAEIQLDPAGRFLYVSNRGQDSISVFRVEPGGTLKRLGSFASGGASPRMFVIDPTGRYLIAANERSDDLVVLKINRETSDLSPLGSTFKIPSPASLAFFVGK